MTEDRPLTNLQEFELLTGTRLFSCTRHESPNGGRYFVLSFDGRTLQRFEVFEWRTASILNSMLPGIRARQGNHKPYPPFDTRGARHVTKLLHLIAETDSAQCELLNPATTEGDNPDVETR